MKALSILILLLGGNLAQAGFDITKIIPTPINPIPFCNACACGNAAKCAEDVARAARFKELEDAARRVQEAERKTKEAVARAAEEKAITVIRDSQNMISELPKRAEETVRLAEREIKRQASLVEVTAKSIEKAGRNPNLIQGLIDDAKEIVQARIKAERDRFMDALGFILKNNMKSLIRERQVLVIVSELEKWADPGSKGLYGFVQASGIPMAQAKLMDWYDQIIVLEKSQATKANLLRVLSEQTAREKIKAVDLFVFLHGLPGAMAFFDNDVTSAQLAKEIASINTQGKLRLVYNTSCFGASHIQDFLRAGFKVASGSQAINANAITEYPAFLELLSLGQPFGAAIAMGNEPVANASWDALAKTSGLSPVNSYKNIGGDLAQGYLYAAAKWVVEGLIKL